MPRKLRIVSCLLALLSSAAACARVPTKPRDFVYLGQDELRQQLVLLDRPEIAGAEVLYPWISLEPRKGGYDFSMIEDDLALAQARHKALYVEVMDRSFRPDARFFPRYLLEQPAYGGGIARQAESKPAPMSGWVARQWDPNVRRRFQALLKALASRFDGRIAGIVLTETAASVDKDAPPKGYSCDAYFAGEVANALAAKRFFRRSAVIQYVNFWPCDWANARGYMGRFFEIAAAHRIGVGGPDILPWQKAHMLNAYAFIRVYRDRLPRVAMAVQEPTLDTLNPETGKPFTREEFVRFASVYLGVDDIFWSVRSPWLHAPAALPPPAK